LITIRILEPASKLRSIKLIETYFGIVHRRQNYYKEAKKWIALKDKILEKVNDFGRKEYGLDYSIVFYDVTTLYFIALAISKHIEIKTGKYIRHFITEAKKITDARMLNTLTQKEVIVKGKITQSAEELLLKLNLLH
jgi:hypothetical protein